MKTLNLMTVNNTNTKVSDNVNVQMFSAFLVCKVWYWYSSMHCVNAHVIGCLCLGWQSPRGIR